ncbi:MAG: hypothetical protein ACK4K4_00205 [Caldimicrobium sp.]
MVEIFLEDAFFKKTLKELSLAIEKSNKFFREKGSFSFCKTCADCGIICCGKGLEWKLSPEEFLINLCLFSQNNESFLFPQNSPEFCLFLGKKGCTLKLVPLFCRNFFCTSLSQYLGEKNLIEIQQAMEEEALLSFKLCEYLKKTLKY